MTDSDLAAAIAEAVRPVWPELSVSSTSGHRLRFKAHLARWTYGGLPIGWLWSAAILMHELERIFVGWTGQEFPRPHNLDAARAAHAKLKELIRAQS